MAVNGFDEAENGLFQLVDAVALFFHKSHVWGTIGQFPGFRKKTVQNDRNVRGYGPDFPEYFRVGLAGQIRIQDQQVRRFWLCDGFQYFLTAFGQNDDISFGGQLAPEKIPNMRIPIGYQQSYGCFHINPSRLVRGGWRLSLGESLVVSVLRGRFFHDAEFPLRA